MNLPIKSHPSLRQLWCNVSVKLLCLQRRVNKLNTTLFDRYYSPNYKSVIFRKLHIILMFQVVFIFSDWILIAQTSFLHPFHFGGKRFSTNSTWTFEWGTGVWRKVHRFNAFSRNAKEINQKNFPTHGGIYKLEKIQQAFWREIKP